MQKLRVGVIFGGRNTEHEVSLSSARFILRSLDQQRYEIVPLGIDKQGRWVWGGDPMGHLERHADQGLLGRAPAAGDVITPGELTISEGLIPPAACPLYAVDVIFPVLHGLLGEDGSLQGFLDVIDRPYVGCGVSAAAVGMDKILMKAAFAAADLPLVPWVGMLRSEWQTRREQLLDSIEAKLRYPVFTKPANAGSSVGVSKCRDRVELAAGLDEAARHDRRLVVEQGVNAREIEVSVLGNEQPEASLPGEIIVGGEWYDYADKYLDGRSSAQIPAEVPAALIEQIRELAVRAFKSIDGAGLSRVDFLLDRDTGELFINEINTLPGFTPISMYPMMWRASGLESPQLLDRLIDLALERHRDRRVRVAEVG